MLTRLMGELSLAIRQRGEECERLGNAAEGVPLSVIEAARDTACQDEPDITEIQRALDTRMRLQMIEFYRLQADECASKADETVELVKCALLRAVTLWDSTKSEISEDYREHITASRNTYADLQSRKRSLIAQLQARRALVARLEQEQSDSPSYSESM